MTISRLMEIGKRSLMTHQSAVNTTSGNIANAGTEGYTRRRVDFSNLSQFGGGIGYIGGGVDAEDFVRVRQRLVDVLYWQENQALGRFEAEERVLTQVEGIFNESGGNGLSVALGEFWNAWSDLGNEPDSTSARAIVRDKGVLVANTFNRLHGDLQQTQQELGTEIEARIDHVNDISEQLASINQQIIRSSSPDLLDRRDMLISDLSKELNIEVREADNGSVTVTTNGLIMVSETEHTQFRIEKSNEDGLQQIQVLFDEHNKEPQLVSGELAALLNEANEQIPAYIASLDEMATQFTEQVNAVHSTGYNLDDITGIDFFEASATGSHNIQVSSAVRANPDLIATRTGGSGIGNSDIAQSIADLQYQDISTGNTLADTFTEMLGGIGNRLQEAGFLRNSQELISTNLLNQRDAISGVSLDEEMTNLIQYQQAYQAAGTIVQTVDEMMTTLLSMV